MKTFNELQATSLIWLPEHGIGKYPVEISDHPYDYSYFDKYKSMAGTKIGKALNLARVEMVKRHWRGIVVDIGIGSGSFIELYGNALGFDINPAGVSWLKDRGVWADLYTETYEALTMWDCLEHLYEPELAVAQAKKWVFLSIPVFDDAEHVLRSKHFRKDEHVFYFTHTGLLRWFDGQGFDCIEHNTMETKLGREGIGSYAFRRRT
ncbi:class I SAM-dependent methyltransferase [Pantoea sp. Bo_2]|uniref:Class I SAM-dependent methyltransferase n=1 Tax=Candidatus Pantoea gossypiicola TaxID=2608008 RepID=A0AB34CK05_9GAMM|nr:MULTISPECIES: methyltransferase domain-containing protein [Pantoea]KAA5949406.1 class I SAM-dependent methyltransferase [Pantoea sp. VH_24]KAA5955308.1 class I SAM-dependent methyltransferase [Pantoea sp. VH_16]KAA5961370.1 class I SAM-dependent methyltransferase [Pantoea sp. VH_18]KAA5991486.1 class I SAM-dependent methyltransferase [Pantoea sp. M_1]KAA5995816.1 class I SAM-dependent methyltransferase [Pantoea sp. F_7]